MPVQIIRNDITHMRVDAIVNAANNQLEDGGGVCGAIHAAAGPKLLAECRTLHGCPTGEARITGAYNLPCKHVIHTVGPVWMGGTQGERELLTACYRNSLHLARAHGCQSIAFPLISAGIFGYPKDQALTVAMNAISAFLMEDEGDMQVYLVVFTRDAVQLGSKLAQNVKQYIDDHYVDEHCDMRLENARKQLLYAQEAMCAPCAPVSCEQSLQEELKEKLKHMDESFSEALKRKIAEKGITNAACYKRANIDKKLFSKINKDIHYRPSKPTALALCIALELPLSDTRDLLGRAGLALSPSEKFDVIVEYFIVHGQFNIFEINEVLYYFDQPLLGGALA